MTPALSRGAGLAAVVTLWSTIAAGTLVTGFPLLGDRPLSWLAEDPASSLLFSAGLLVAAALLVAFTAHVRARYRVGSGFTAAMLIGQAGQAVAALAPIGGAPAVSRLHTAGALTLGASLPLLMWRFAAGQPAGRWRQVAYGLFWVEAAACVAGVLLSRRSVAPLAEILPAVAFHLWIGVLTLRRSPAEPATGPPPQDLVGLVSSRRSEAGTAVRG